MSVRNTMADGAETQRVQPQARKTIADGRMLEFLVCPVTRGKLHYDAEHQELISPSARLAYPIRDGIAIMVPDEARHLDDPRQNTATEPPLPGTTYAQSTNA